MSESVRHIAGRGVEWCRGCGAHGLVSVLDLGEQPLANELSRDPDIGDPMFPLHLNVCPVCGLGQLGEFVAPERIFADDYPYFSSVSRSWVEHAERFADQMMNELDLCPDDLVVEVASNDGYLLQHFLKRGVRVLGVEPAGDVAETARDRGVATLNDFFGVETARTVVARHGHPRLVVANNVMAHVPDLVDFTGGFAALANNQTLLTVENPTFVNLLRGTQFDTIYHEHFSYLTAHAVSRAVAPVGLELVGVESLPTHGGSNRYRLALQGAHPVHDSAAATVAAELAAGLLDAAVWSAFHDASWAAVDGLRRWLDDRRSTGRRVAAYGAAAKGNTLLNAAGVSAHDVLAVADGSTHKQGKLLPGSKVPVVAPTDMPTNIDDILVLPWNLAHEIVPLARAAAPAAKCWAAVPTMRELP